MQFVIVEGGTHPSLIGQACGFIRDDDLVHEFLKIAERCFDPVRLRCLSSTYLVALSPEDDLVVGGCGVSITNGLHIDMLCVDSLRRNRGVGTAIVDAAARIGESLNEKCPDWIDAVTPYGNGVFPDGERRQLTLEFDRGRSRLLHRFYAKNGFEIHSFPGATEFYCRRSLVDSSA